MEVDLVADNRDALKTTDWQSASDAVLLHAAGERNQQAFAVLVARYHTQVYRVAWRLNGGHVDTDDIAQETFLKLWNNPAQLREAAALKGWLMRVASNLVMDRYRQKPMAELDEAFDVVDTTLSAPAMLDQNYVTKTIDAAIAALPDRQKLALALVHFEHMTNIAAAAAMEISVDALESLLARARRGLKDKLGSNGRQLLAVLATQGQT
ncbi:MAG: sigma-70 family RNA polymerase sigma factor [Alphaproteobacteria bacterium]|nr:sigma-70 family RNA polymerase sigma factor [Alphaproteobacteria bacterium]